MVQSAPRPAQPVIRTALVLAPPAGDRRWVTGLTLGERGRRVARRAGFTDDRIVLVRSAEELAAAADRLTGPLLVLRASDQVVAAPLVDALELDRPGTRYAIDPARGDGYAGALVVDSDRAAAVLAAQRADLARGDDQVRATWPDATAVAIADRARFPVPTPADVAAATRWQWELVNKSLDAPITRYFYRPLARPLTNLFLHTPLSPNAISVISIILSLVGCAIAAGASSHAHILGLALLLAGGIVDCNDGEVARLRLEMSKAGAWIDAMGDDAARLALLLGLGGHVAHVRPSWPVWPITLAAGAMTVAALAMIYWYCIVVIHSSNNQDYTRALAIGPGIATGGKRSVGRVIADWGAQIVRRDFIDLGVLVLALFQVPEIGFIGLSAGALVTLVIVIPTHLKIVKNLRATRAA